MESFFDKIKKRLERMTEAEKDAWILSQAKILPDCKTYYCIDIKEKDPLLTEIKKKLTEDLSRYEEELADAECPQKESGKVG